MSIDMLWDLPHSSALFKNPFRVLQYNHRICPSPPHFFQNLFVLHRAVSLKMLWKAWDVPGAARHHFFWSRCGENCALQWDSVEMETRGYPSGALFIAQPTKSGLRKCGFFLGFATTNPKGARMCKEQHSNPENAPNGIPVMLSTQRIWHGPVIHTKDCLWCSSILHPVLSLEFPCFHCCWSMLKPMSERDSVNWNNLICPQGHATFSEILLSWIMLFTQRDLITGCSLCIGGETCEVTQTPPHFFTSFLVLNYDLYFMEPAEFGGEFWCLWIEMLEHIICQLLLNLFVVKCAFTQRIWDRPAMHIMKFLWYSPVLHTRVTLGVIFNFDAV